MIAGNDVHVLLMIVCVLVWGSVLVSVSVWVSVWQLQDSRDTRGGGGGAEGRGDHTPRRHSGTPGDGMELKQKEKQKQL